MNHRRGEGHGEGPGYLMSEMQEEMALIIGFGLLWIAVNLGWRAVTGGLGHEGSGHSLTSSGGGARPYPCSDDDILCIFEEYSYF
ncbi:hypothetical protein BT96DRAFT_380033 [Gymnopus androsaceus JB14]|uniref:Uncharacterized protein n=1 Tax=Gymnopus androsaceus JB14 TaxID=1447944 RepID=A0A6A4IIT6_9AGAR|nr:hypothetical protein BT96DRAFT_380033 [Gymnopus androsaceus JB14]